MPVRGVRQLNLMKKIVKLFFALAVLLSATTARAHRPDISSFTLVERAPGQWLLRVNASLTAFEHEVEHAYGKGAYASPEEFNQLVLDHLREQITIRTNEDEVTLADGSVKLGHATTVVFTLSGVADEIEEVFAKNEGFKSIHNSQVIFTLAKEGWDNHQWVLSEENGYQLSGSVKDHQVLLSEASSGSSWIMIAAIAVIVGLFGWFLFKRSRRKKTIVLPINHNTLRH